MQLNKFNEAQVRFICEEMAKIQKMPSGVQPGQRPENRSAPKTAAMEELARKVGCQARHLYSLINGRVDYARPWVYAWAREQRKTADANGSADVPIRPKGARIAEAVKAKARKLAAQGAPYPYISKVTGIPTGSLYYVVKGQAKAAAAKAAPERKQRTPERKAAAPIRREEDWGQNFRAYVEAEEEKARAAMAERHAQERAALEEQLTAKRQTVVERLLELYTEPELRGEYTEGRNGAV